MNTDNVLILLATYNGEKYLQQQLDSIINQTYNNWELIIRDDGSKDNTKKLVQEYCSKDNRIKFIETPSEYHGARANFGELYNWAKKNRDVNYLMFSDQDDIWLSHKIEKSLSEIKSSQKTLNEGTPIMLYGNLQLIDEQNSKLDAKIALISEVSFSQILVTNYAFGCTMMLNKALFDLVDRIPHNAENHDYWVAIFAVAFGKTKFVNEPLLLYRQHDKNVTSQGSGLKKRFDKYYFQINKQVSELIARIQMFTFFAKHYSNLLNQQDSLLKLTYLVG